MHGKQAIIILISLKIMCLQTNDLLNILESDKNFFFKINSQLHTLTNKLFGSLNLAHKFTTNSKTKALLAMHSDLNHLAEKHSSNYNYIKNITSLTVKDNITDLEKLFKEIIFYDEADVHKRNEVVNVTSTAVKNNDTLEFELESLVDKVLDKIAKQSIQGVLLITNKTRRNKVSKPTLRKIKVWQPSISSENITRRIYKGKKTRIKKYPFLVSIHLKNEFSCAGSIISKDFVITAATCLQTAYNISGELPPFFVRVGSDYTNRLGEIIPVIDIFFHPGYTPEDLQNNIAIIRIMKRVKFSKERKIQRIQYARDENIDDDKSVTILGWGAKDTNQEICETHRVSVAHLDIYDFDECTEVYTRYYIRDNNFCAGFVSKGGGACNVRKFLSIYTMRDVGGPAVISGRLVGIISFGPLVCGMTDAPTVFTKVGSYVKWINDTISQKPQMRNTKTAKTLLKKPARAFPMPVLLLTTSNPIHPATVSSDTTKGTTERIHPDEINILREILQEVVFSNSSIIDYILYGDMLPNEKEAVNIPTAAKRVQITNRSKLIERQNKRSRIKPVLTDKSNDDESSNYEDTDTGMKILKSLVEFNTFNERFTTPKRFRVTDNKNLKHQAFDKVINNSVEYAEGPDINDGRQSTPNDSSNYYEDEPGLSIEITKGLIGKDIGRENNIFEKATTRKSKNKRIQLEDYKNIIFSLNPLRESRDKIVLDRKRNNKGTVENARTNKLGNNKSDMDLLGNTTKKNTKHIKNMKLDKYKNIVFNLNPYKESNINKNREKYGESKPADKDEDRKTISQKTKQENSESDDNMKMNMQIAPVGLAMAISDEDFDYDKLFDKQEYDNTMRSRYDKEPLRWRFRSKA